MNDQLFQMESRIKPSEQFIALSNEVLHELIHTTSGIEGVLLSSTDGFEVNSIFKNLWWRQIIRGRQLNLGIGTGIDRRSAAYWLSLSHPRCRKR